MTLRAPGQRSGTGGFTVMEVMAAVVILAIALMSLLRANNQSVMLRARTQDITTATLLAQERLASFRTEIETLEEESEGDFGEAFPYWRWTMEKEEVEIPFDFGELETVKSVTGGDEDEAGGAAAGAGTSGAAENEPTPLQKITLTVFWPEGVREGSLTFVEYFAPRPEEVEDAGPVGAPPPPAGAPAPQQGGAR